MDTTLWPQSGSEWRWFGSQLHSRGDLHALDNFCDFTGHVAARIGQFLHVGWVYPHSAGYRRRGAADQLDHRTQGGALRQTLRRRELLQKNNLIPRRKK